MQKILSFLEDLKRNNNREWFNENKAVYQEALDLFRGQVSDIIKGILQFDPSLLNLKEKDAIFRIYKDVRFSKDKTPYKTHFGAYISRGGRKSPDAGYYFHVEPGNTFIAAGVYMPDKDRLKVIRQEIMFGIDEYMKIIKESLAKDYVQHFQEKKLKKAPKGFPQDFEHIEQLKFKHFIFAKNYPDSQVLENGFIDSAISGFKGLNDYVYYLNKAMDFIGNE